MTVRCGSWTWLLALALLQTATALPWHGDAGRWLTSLAQPSPDLVCLLVAVLAGTAAGWPRSSAWTAGLLLWIAALLRPFVELFPQVFQRPFELADLLQIPGLLHLLMANAPLWQQVVVVVAVVAIWPLLALAFVRVARMARSPRVDRRVLFGSQAAVLLGLLLAPLVWQSSILLAVVTHTYLATKLWLDADRIEAGIRADIDAGIGRMVAAPLELGGLRGIDVHVLVVESYGAMAWRERPLRPRIEALWQELAGPLRDHGFAGVSGRTHPSITGGGSWLAHQELFTSVAVPDQRTFDRVLQSRAQALPWVFRKAGWHTVEMMPAMPRHWREGDAFYGFTEGLVQPDLEYSGHAYGFGKVPDQVALQQLLERVVAPAQQPLFVVFVSTSSHSPWSETPPFLADWQLNPAALARPIGMPPIQPLPSTAPGT